MPGGRWASGRGVPGPGRRPADLGLLGRDAQEYLDSGRLTLLHDSEEPPLNTLFLVQRPGAEVNPHVLRVRDRLLAAVRGRRTRGR
jgi:hypothetical protein